MNFNIEEVADAGSARGPLVTKAMLRAADYLEINNTELGRILGISPSSVGRMRDGTMAVEKGKSYELAVLFLRMFRSLDAIVGGDATAASAWLRAQNVALRGVPVQLIQTIHGMSNVLFYLDARRAVL